MIAKKKSAVKPRTKPAVRASARRVEVIAADIKRNRRLGKGIRWVIAAEVRVAAGVTLTIADGAEILIANGVVPESRVRRAALIFEAGASDVEMPRGCWVRLRGVFGDELHLTSDDMPRPVRTDDNERRYAFTGKLKSDALIHTLTSD